MASQGVTANSRLAEMQMKFQNKQKLEREQKKLALTGGDISQELKNNNGNGKVRQMFDDRRRGVGIDRSHPLRPIMTSSISTTVTTRTTTQQPVASNKVSIGKKIITKPIGYTNTTSMHSKTMSSGNLNNTYSRSNGNVSIFGSDFDEVDNIDNETFPKEFSSLSLNNTQVMDSYVKNDRDIENNVTDETSVLGATIIINKNSTLKTTKTNGIKLNPVITKKSVASTGKIANRNSGNSSRISSLSKNTTSPIKSPLPKTVAAPSPATKTIKTVGTKTSNTKPATFVLSVKPPPRISTPPPGMASCPYCHRHFNEERLSKHEDVCKKMMSKKRKIFDASKHRVKGTEAEKYLKKGSSSKSSTATIINTTKVAKVSGEKKNNWRKKHEDFITAIREAKKVQVYLAKGGKLSDLPPPPPSENPDYIQCPHCSRRFNQSAAERHIPRCANMQHNKPKPVKKRS